MCNLYSETKGQAAIRALFRVRRDSAGNLPSLPAIYPDGMAPIVHTARDANTFDMLEICQNAIVGHNLQNSVDKFEVFMSNGKKLGDCTSEDLEAMSKRFRQAKQHIDEVFNELVRVHSAKRASKAPLAALARKAARAPGAPK